MGLEVGDMSADLVGEGEAGWVRELDDESAVGAIEGAGAVDGAGDGGGEASGVVWGGLPHDNEGVADEADDVTAPRLDVGEEDVEDAVDGLVERVDAVRAERLRVGQMSSHVSKTRVFG